MVTNTILICQIEMSININYKILILSGTVSIIYLVIFILIKSASWGINMDTEWATSWVIRPTFPALTGMLAMSFFIHNIIISIMKNNRNQKKNVSYFKFAY